MAFRGSDSHGQGPFTAGACAKRSFKPHLHETHVGAARYLSSPDLCVSKLEAQQNLSDTRNRCSKNTEELREKIGP